MDFLSFQVDKNNVFYRCVEDSTEAIMITDSTGKLVYVNPAWQKIYEYSFEEAVGRTPRLLRSRFQNDEFYKQMWLEILDSGKGSWRGDLVNKSKSGKEVPVTLTITPIRHNNVAVGYMGIAIDTTEKRNMEAKIFQQDRLASVGFLASGLAHEIGTPLGVIRGRAELIKSQIKNDLQALPGLEIIIQQIDRVTKLINSLLTLSRDSRSGGKCVVNDVIAETLGLLAQKFRDFGVEIEIDIPLNTIVSMDHNKLEQVLINLLVNAIHAIRSAYKEGRKDQHKIKIYLEEQKNKVKIFISDTGCGISEDNQKYLFRPFYTTKEVGEGTGLGLSISHQIVNEYKGNLVLENSKVGQGTVFSIELSKG